LIDFHDEDTLASKQSIQLGTVQETLLVPLYARAVDSRRKRSLLNDPKAVEMVESIDWDFQRFNQRRRTVGCILRSAIYDEYVKDFLSRHPQGTVVEIGAGLNTRFERIDNGTVHWFDLDLPDTIELRRKFFADTARRTTLTASVLDPGWITTVRQSPGPYCFVAEAVFIYLTGQQVRTALAQIADNFPQSIIVFDTGNRRAVDHENKDHARLNLSGRFAWACDDPKEIENWKIGLRLIESRSMMKVPDSLWSRLSLPTRAVLRILRKFVPQIANAYRFNLFAASIRDTP
jgi:O-methyltransferase involved in polyketide biosynthesis